MTLNSLNCLHSSRFYNLLKGLILIITLSISFSGLATAQPSQNVPKSLDKRDNWEAKDLIEPAVLASMLNDKKAKQPVIFNIGVVEDILGSKNVGAASKKENSDRLKENLKGLKKNTLVVIYCGCCPFDKCPNIRPAFGVLKSMGFSNGKLLNIPNNLKQNWISKGYPIISSNSR